MLYITAPGNQPMNSKFNLRTKYEDRNHGNIVNGKYKNKLGQPLKYVGHQWEIRIFKVP